MGTSCRVLEIRMAALPGRVEGGGGGGGGKEGGGGGTRLLARGYSKGTHKVKGERGGMS